MARNSLSHGIMAPFRKTATLIGLFFTLVTSVDSFGANLSKETFEISKCAKALSFLNLRLVPDNDDNRSWVRKIPNWNKKSAPPYEFFIRENSVEIHLNDPFSNSAVSEAILKFPHFMNEFGFNIIELYQGDVTRSWGTNGLNKLLLSQKGTPLERPFTFVDNFPPPNRSQVAPEVLFLELLRLGKILLATGGGEFVHDRFEEHMVTNLFMPQDVFWNFQKEVELTFGLKEIFPHNPFVDKLFQSRVENLTNLWEKASEFIGTTIAKETAEEALAPNSQILYKYQNIAMGLPADDYLKKISAELERSHYPVTKRQKAQVEDLYLRTKKTSIPSDREIRKSITDQLTFAGEPHF